MSSKRYTNKILWVPSKWASVDDVFDCYRIHVMQCEHVWKWISFNTEIHSMLPSYDFLAKSFVFFRSVKSLIQPSVITKRCFTDRGVCTEIIYSLLYGWKLYKLTPRLNIVRHHLPRFRNLLHLGIHA